jgi:hypothetical protein
MTGDIYSEDHELKEAYLRMAIGMDRLMSYADTLASRSDRDHPGVPMFCTPPDGTAFPDGTALIQFQVANVLTPAYYILIQNNTAASIYFRLNRPADATGLLLPAGSYYETDKVTIATLGLYAPSGFTLNGAGGIIVEAMTTEYVARLRTDPI